MQKNHWWREYTELAVLFFLHAMAMGMWFVPLGSVLDASDYHTVRVLGVELSIKALAFATSGISAFISPLLVGALADQRFAPVKVLRVLALCTSGAMGLAATAVANKWPPGVLLILIQLHALCSTPTWSISTTVVLARLGDARREFGPIRAMATVGWMTGCWLVSALNADRTALAGYSGAVVWLFVAAFTFVLPIVAPPAPKEHLTWRQRLGLDALVLFKNRDNRVVFLTAALFNIPMCAFYPYTPTHLAAVGLDHTTAWMTLGQVTEALTMFALAGLLTRWRLKWIFLTGISFGFVRYVACALDTRLWLLVGVTLHGFAFSLFFITAQIYLEQRIDPAFRARAQALYTLMLSGVGSTLGYLGCGAWFAACQSGGTANWRLFWGGLAACVLLIGVWFCWAYRGRKAGDLGGRGTAET